MAIDDDLRENPKTCCVVIGGRSFIGRSLVSMLLKSESWIVRIADSDHSLNLDLNEKNSLLSEAISSERASYFHVDVRDRSQIIRAIEGSSVVFHMSPTASSIHDFYLQYMVTVQGTKNVINACRECKVKRLIYNSSADVVSDGIHDISDGDDSLPYPCKFQDMLSDLKAQAEAIILSANSGDGLLTCALRPSNAFGPGDEKLVPFLLRAEKSGLAKFIVGNGENMCDFTFVDNIAHAHICTEEALRSNTAFVAGKAFFITNLDPMRFWDFVSLIFEGLGYPRPRFKIPARLVWFMAVFSNWVPKNVNAILTPAAFHQFSRTMTFNCSEAQNQIRYSPIVSIEEGIGLTIKSFSNVSEDSLDLRYGYYNESTKVDRLLGSGRVADLLLWRDEKKTFACFLALALLNYWFILSGRTFVSSAAKLLILISTVLFGYGILPASLFGFTVKKLSPFQFEASETVENAIVSLASAWNHAIHILRVVAQGGDWNIFLKVMVSLCILKLLFSLPLAAVTSLALVLAFTAFFIYMQYEDEADRLVEFSSIGIQSLMGLLTRNLPETVATHFYNYQIIDENKGHPLVKD